MGASASAGLNFEADDNIGAQCSRRTIYVASTSSESADKGNDAELIATINKANTAASNLALESARLATALAKLQETTSGRVQAQKDVVMHRQKEQLHIEQLAAARDHLRVYNQVRSKVTIMAPKNGKAKKGKKKKGAKEKSSKVRHKDDAADEDERHDAHESEDATKGKKAKGSKKAKKSKKKKGADEREEERAEIEDEAAAGVEKYKQRIVQHEAKIKEHQEGRIAAERYLGNSNAEVLAARRTCKVRQMAHDSAVRADCHATLARTRLLSEGSTSFAPHLLPSGKGVVRVPRPTCREESLEAVRVARDASHAIRVKARAARCLAQEYELARGLAELEATQRTASTLGVGRNISAARGDVPLQPAAELAIFRKLRKCYNERRWERPRLFVAATPLLRALRGGKLPRTGKLPEQGAGGEAAGCPRCVQCQLLLALYCPGGFDVVPIGLEPERRAAKWFLAPGMSPDGRLPVLECDGDVIIGANAIEEWVTSRLQPSQTGCGQVLCSVTNERHNPQRDELRSFLESVHAGPLLYRFERRGFRTVASLAPDGLTDGAEGGIDDVGVVMRAKTRRMLRRALTRRFDCNSSARSADNVQQVTTASIEDDSEYCLPPAPRPDTSALYALGLCYMLAPDYECSGKVRSEFELVPPQSSREKRQARHNLQSAKSEFEDALVEVNKYLLANDVRTLSAPDLHGDKSDKDAEDAEDSQSNADSEGEIFPSFYANSNACPTFILGTAKPTAADCELFGILHVLLVGLTRFKPGWRIPPALRELRIYIKRCRSQSCWAITDALPQEHAIIAMLVAALEPFQSSLSAAAPTLRWAAAAFRENAIRRRASAYNTTVGPIKDCGNSCHKDGKVDPPPTCVFGAELLRRLRGALARPDGSTKASNSVQLAELCLVDGRDAIPQKSAMDQLQNSDTDSAARGDKALDERGRKRIERAQLQQVAEQRKVQQTRMWRSFFELLCFGSSVRLHEPAAPHDQRTLTKLLQRYLRHIDVVREMPGAAAHPPGRPHAQQQQWWEDPSLLLLKEWPAAPPTRMDDIVNNGGFFRHGPTLSESRETGIFDTEGRFSQRRPDLSKCTMTAAEQAALDEAAGIQDEEVDLNSTSEEEYDNGVDDSEDRVENERATLRATTDIEADIKRAGGFDAEKTRKASFGGNADASSVAGAEIEMEAQKDEGVGILELDQTQNIQNKAAGTVVEKNTHGDEDEAAEL